MSGLRETRAEVGCGGNLVIVSEAEAVRLS